MTPTNVEFRREADAPSSRVALVAGLSAAGCGHRAAPMARSVPVALAAAPDAKTLEAAIEIVAGPAVTGRSRSTARPATSRSSPSRATRRTVAVLYDAHERAHRLRRQPGLLYENGSDGEVIHRSYNTWVKNLANDIRDRDASQAQLSAASARAK